MAAAEAIVPKDVAEIVANLIASEGAQLATWLQKAGIVSEKELDLAHLHKYSQRHCAVIEGHLVEASQEVEKSGAWKAVHVPGVPSARRL